MAEYEDNNIPNEYNVPIWDDKPLPIVPGYSHTPFGYYDDDILFRNEAYKFSKWASRRLGYPIVNIELQSGSFYACFEEAVTEYSSIINQFNMRENILYMQGSEYSENTNISQTPIRPNLGRIIEIAKEYGNEAGSGGNITWYSASFNLEPGVQIYNIEQAISRSMYEQGMINQLIENNIEVKRVYHNAPPAIGRYFNPYVGTGNMALMTSFGWDRITGINYMMMPLFNDLLRIQAVEFNDQIRRSAYSFEILNNNFRIFPVPRDFYRVYFNFIFKSDRNSYTYDNKNNSLMISDASNAPFKLMKYSNINIPGRQWIMKWALALCKETLGAVRSKYSTIPIPNTDVTLDGSELRQQAQTEKESLLAEMKEMLDSMSKKNQLVSKQEESDALNNILGKVPLPIFIA